MALCEHAARVGFECVPLAGVERPRKPTTPEAEEFFWANLPTDVCASVCGGQEGYPAGKIP